jgi:aquaporin related protein
MFLTAQLVFTIFMLATEKHEGTFIAPVGIGLSLFVAELMGVFYTGGSLNPARSFGPAVVSHTFSSYHWIYWVGPILGAFLASAFYMFIKACKYHLLSFNTSTGANHCSTVEYETVNLEVNDPKKALGEKFDRTSKKEKPESPPRTVDSGYAPERHTSGGSGDTFDRAPTLENGHPPRH